MPESMQGVFAHGNKILLRKVPRYSVTTVLGFFFTFGKSRNIMS